MITLAILAIAAFALLAVWLALETRPLLSRLDTPWASRPIGLKAYFSLYLDGVRRAGKSFALRPLEAIRFAAMPVIAGGAPKLSELRKRVAEAVERMEKADKAINDAGEDGDHDALNSEFDAAEEAHRTAKADLERAERVAEARAAAPVEPVEDEEPGTPGEPGTPAEPAAVEHQRGPGGALLLSPAQARQARVAQPWADRTHGRVRVSKEATTYERHGEHSVFADLAKVAVDSDPAASARLARHREEMDVEQRALPAHERAHPNQALGEGGEFIAPLWMQDEWIRLPRAGRVIADSLNRKPHPGTNQVNLPKIATGTATERQPEDGGAVKSTDATTTVVTGQTQTVAGQQDVSMQLVDLSNPGMDEVLFDDLGRDYNQKVDVLVINSSVTNAKGLLQVSGTNTVTYTDASPTVSELYPKFGAANAEVAEGIFRPPTVYAMTPRRWFWYTSAVDSQGRPLAPAGNAVNAAAKLDRVAAEGIVGEIQGVPVIIDANLPKNEGGGTNQDTILCYSADDLYLFEDNTPRVRVLKEVLSGTLQVRFQIYNYVMLISGRLPKAISKIQGTGLVTPAF